MSYASEEAVAHGKRRGRKVKAPRAPHERRRRREEQLSELAELEALAVAQAPERGTLVRKLKDDYNDEEAEEGSEQQKRFIRKFQDLAISRATKLGLKEAKYKRLTLIQSYAIPHALVHRDVLAAAKTGSGKTLAFLIPLLEKLYRLAWSRDDGLGAIILTPTRELALQIFEELKMIGKHHEFSAGLVIGGKDVEAERERIGKMNIIVSTPGRLLDHLDSTVAFNTESLQMLVLDEADRILDMGFSKALNAIVEHLPSSRQTLLFSATQTRSVADLARLSLKEPEYISVHEASLHSTPSQLSQGVMTCELHEKLDIVYSFLKTHTGAKTLFFLNSCKEVRFFYEAFRKLRLPMSIMHLHGRQKQMRRMNTYALFCEKKRAALFATDIAARGLDFPNVDWVVQIDCPEDTDTYIHRVGRTARYKAGGNALLLLCPSEAKMLEYLEERRIPFQQCKPNPKRTSSVRKQLEAMLSEDAELKYLAQKAFISYLRSIHLASDKALFSVDVLPTKEFAASLGLPGAPKIKFTKKRGMGKNVDYRVQQLLQEGLENDEEEEQQDGQAKKMTKEQRLRIRQNQGVLSERFQRLQASESDEGESEAVSSGSDGEDDTAEENGTDSSGQESGSTAATSSSANGRGRDESTAARAGNEKKRKKKKTGGVQGESEDEGDELFRLKRKDHELNDEELPDPESGMTNRQRKREISRRKKLAGATVEFEGEHVVFDDESQIDFEKEAAKTVEEFTKKLQKSDKRDVARGRRERKQARREARKERQRLAAGGGVMIGGGGGYEDGEEWEGSSGEDGDEGGAHGWDSEDSSDEEVEVPAPAVVGSKRKRGHDEEEESAEEHKKKKKKKSKKKSKKEALAEMQDSSADEDEDDESPTAKRAKYGKDPKNLTLEEQEALAMELLGM